MMIGRPRGAVNPKAARKALRGLPFAVPDPDNWHVRNLLTFDVGPDSRIRNVFRAAVGNFLEFLMASFVVLIYLVFLVAERVSLPGRIARAFGEARLKLVRHVCGGAPAHHLFAGGVDTHHPLELGVAGRASLELGEALGHHMQQRGV